MNWCSRRNKSCHGRVNDMFGSCFDGGKRQSCGRGVRVATLMVEVVRVRVDGAGGVSGVSCFDWTATKWWGRRANRQTIEPSAVSG